MIKVTTGMSPVLCLCLVVGLPVSGQEVPFTGVIVENNVKVRSGAGTAYYVVGELTKSTFVQVDEVIWGWYKIVCPQGVYSYISKAFVDAKGDGLTGLVNRDGVEVKAGDLRGPGHSVRVQIVLNKGDTVRIIPDELTERSSFYKIMPPVDAYVYVAPRSIRRASASELAAAQQTDSVDPTLQLPLSRNPLRTGPDPYGASPSPKQPAPYFQSLWRTNLQPEPGPPPLDRSGNVQPDPEQDSTPDPVAIQAPTAPTGPAPRSTERTAATTPGVPPNRTLGANQAAASVRLRDLEDRMLQMLIQPLEEQPIESMIHAYERLAETKNLSNREHQIVALRIETLRRNQQLAQALKRIVEVKPSGVRRDPAIYAPAIQYSAVGRLMASSVYDGRRLPQLFRLANPASGRTIAYVQPGDQIEVWRTLGQVVGIVGDQQFDGALKLNMLSVERIDVIEVSERRAAMIQPDSP